MLQLIDGSIYFLNKICAQIITIRLGCLVMVLASVGYVIWSLSSISWCSCSLTTVRMHKAELVNRMLESRLRPIPTQAMM